MCEVFLLYEGYSTQIDDVIMFANCSCVLIKSPNKNVIVDTMTAWDKQAIVEALAKHQLNPEDINFVVCTHSHADHIGNNNLFLKADEHIIGTAVEREYLFYERDIKNADYTLVDDVRVMATPGHTGEDVTVIVKGKFEGNDVTVAITGDLFEKQEDIDDPTIWIDCGTPYLKEEQATSRFKVANIADVIIPGHGPAFKVTEEVKKKLEQQLFEIKSQAL